MTSYGKTYEIHDTLNASGVNHYLQATGSPYLGDKSGYDLWTFELVDGYTDRYYIKNCDGYYWTSNVSSTAVSSKEDIIKCSNTKSNAAIIEISFRKNGVADFCIYESTLKSGIKV